MPNITTNHAITYTNINKIVCILRKQPFPLVPRRWRRFTRKNVCDSAIDLHPIQRQKFHTVFAGSTVCVFVDFCRVWFSNCWMTAAAEVCFYAYHVITVLHFWILWQPGHHAQIMGCRHWTRDEEHGRTYRNYNIRVSGTKYGKVCRWWVLLNFLANSFGRLQVLNRQSNLCDVKHSEETSSGFLSDLYWFRTSSLLGVLSCCCFKDE